MCALKKHAIAVTFILRDFSENDAQRFLSSKEGWEFLIKLQIEKIDQIASIAKDLALKVDSKFSNCLSVPFINAKGEKLHKEIVVSFEHFTKVEIFNIVLSCNKS